MNDGLLFALLSGAFILGTVLGWMLTADAKNQVIDALIEGMDHERQDLLSLFDRFN